MQLGVAKSFSDACVQYQAKNLFSIVLKFIIKLFFMKMGVLHLTPTKYSPILVGSEIMPSAELCIYIILNEEFDPLDLFD